MIRRAVPRHVWAACTTAYSGPPNYASHFDGVFFSQILQIRETSFTLKFPLFVMSSLLNGDFKILKPVGKL
jgi:hypothetical protein